MSRETDASGTARLDAARATNSGSSRTTGQRDPHTLSGDAPNKAAARTDSRSTGTTPAALGYVGLQQTLSQFRDDPYLVPSTLLTALIHSMGGAPTSISRGAYVSVAA